MNEGVIASADYKVSANGRKYPAKRIHMGTKEQQVSEASYRGNIGVMELAKFHSTAKPADKEKFTELMKKKASAKTDEEQRQMASQIWDHVQKVTGTKLHQMESTMIPFKTMLESKEDFILQSLADKDINASIKDGKVVVHDHSQHAKAKSMVKRMGMPHEVVKSVKEELEESKKVTGSVHDWKRKLPDDLSHIDSTEVEGVSHAYKMVQTPGGKKKHLVGKYYHKSGYGEIHEDIEAETSGTVEALSNGNHMKEDYDDESSIQEGLSPSEFLRAVDKHKLKQAVSTGHVVHYVDNKGHHKAAWNRKTQKGIVDINHTGSGMDLIDRVAKNESFDGTVQESKPTPEEVHKFLGRDKDSYLITYSKKFTRTPSTIHSAHVRADSEESARKYITNKHRGAKIHNSELVSKGEKYDPSKHVYENADTVVQEAMPTHEFNKLVRGYLAHKKAAKIGGFKPMSMDQYKRTSVKALSVKEDIEEIDELSKETLSSYQKKALDDTNPKKAQQRMFGTLRSAMKLAKKKTEVKEDKNMVVPTLKPRDPNYKILAAKKNAGGAHRDKKKEMKRGNDKHKSRMYEETQSDSE